MIRRTIKVSKSSSMRLLLLLIFLLDVGFWFVFSIESSLTGRYTKKLIVILSVILAVYYFFCYKKGIWRNNHYLNRFLVCALIIVGIITGYSAWAYPKQGFSGTLAVAYYFWAIVIVYPIYYFFYRDGSIEKLLNQINTIAGIYYLVIFCQSVVYKITGVYFLKGYGTIAFRDGNIRIDMLVLGNLFLLYNLYKVLRKKREKKAINYLYLLIGIYDLIFVQQTRMYSLCFIGSALILYIVEGKKNNRLAKILLVLFAGIYVLFGTGIVDAFISSFSVFGEYGAGTRVRIEAIGYYMQYLRKNPLLGMGYVHEASYKNILMGNDGRYYLSDLGIIGLMAQGGILTLCVYLLFIIRMAYIYMKLKTKSVEHLSLLAAILVFVLLTTPTLIVWSRSSMIYIGLIMAVFEYEYRTVYYDSYKKNP